jgi:hypothetical protein
VTHPEDTVTLLRTEYTKLLMDAAAWRTLWASPHVAEIIAEYFQWLERADFRETSSAISAAHDWRAESSIPTFAELERRRAHYDKPAKGPEQIRARVRWSWARVERAIKPGRAA